MRLLGFGLGLLVALFGLALGCGESDGNEQGSGGAGAAGRAGNTTANDPATAGSASQAGKDAGGHANGGTSGQATGGVQPTAGASRGGAAPVAGTASDGGDANGGGGEPNTSPELVSCDARKVLCRIATPQCAEGEVVSIVGTCWGKCVKIDQCACSDAAECPLPNEYTCWMKSHCGPFVR